jgi:hypothetical protein
MLVALCEQMRTGEWVLAEYVTVGALRLHPANVNQLRSNRDSTREGGGAVRVRSPVVTGRAAERSDRQRAIPG